MADREKLLQIVKETLKENPHVLVGVVYGSLASGGFRPESDVDAAVLLPEALSPDERVAMATKIEKRVHREVDLVDLRTASGLLLKEILTKGVRVVQRDNFQWAELMKRMVYEQEDFMPYYRRLLKARRERFLNGSRSD